jgi:hypothetical protein
MGDVIGIGGGEPPEPPEDEGGFEVELISCPECGSRSLVVSFCGQVWCSQPDCVQSIEVAWQDSVD